MNKTLDDMRLDCGIARLEDNKTLVVCDKDGNIIDPLVGLEMFALRAWRRMTHNPGYVEKYLPNGFMENWALKK